MKLIMSLFFSALIFTQSRAIAAEVNIYSARNEVLIKPLLDQFTQQSGIEVNLVTGDADALIKRLEIEGDNSPADLLLTVDVARLQRAKEINLLQPVTSEILSGVIPETYRDNGSYWFGLSLRSRVIVYAKDRVKPDQLSSYEALSEPAWKGRICVRSSSHVYNQSLVASLIAHNGVDATEQWAKGLVGNFARPPQGGDRDQIKAIAVGQCDLALVNTYYLGGMLHSELEDEIQAAEKVALFWPNQSDRGAHINISGAGVTKSAKNKAEAVKLLEFMTSDGAQAWYAEKNYEYPVRSGIAISDTLKQWGEFVADELNLDRLGQYNAEAVRLMDRAGWK
ncbi:MAG: Fe(3+) ABC transporter substrate-binding protein [Gammaproteobacteria bacterium]|nr:Fe(3+) ABC transporter substrate-binding protein [Gammaproteobacteria bacterium]